MSRVAGKVALITGAGSASGEVLARRFAAQGPVVTSRPKRLADGKLN
jgi:NAD(P)-dependent dehydrogenase (short-subunit alcohol dehydrogenase family)